MTVGGWSWWAAWKTILFVVIVSAVAAQAFATMSWWLLVPLFLVLLMALGRSGLGGSDPDDLHFWANACSSEGRWELADALRERAFADDLDAVAERRCAESQHREAEALYLQALAIRGQYLGETHPETIANLDHLAEVYHQMHQSAKAGALIERARKAREAAEAARRFGIGLVVQTDDVAALFSSIAAAEGYLEGMDVFDYPRAFDPEGRVYDVAPKDHWTVAITPIPNEPPDPEALRELLTRFLQHKGGLLQGVGTNNGDQTEALESARHLLVRFLKYRGGLLQDVRASNSDKLEELLKMSAQFIVT